jgi:aspartyl-tRNA(Asn)/glutamyl-tRNA(Gln) amidotransferase subunit C
MSLTLADVEKIAHLARLELTAAEKSQYQNQLSAILDYAARLDELDVTAVLPTTSAIPLVNVVRDDSVVPSLPLAEVLYNAPQQAGGQFQIKTVLAETQ